MKSGFLSTMKCMIGAVVLLGATAASALDVKITNIQAVNSGGTPISPSAGLFREGVTNYFDVTFERPLSPTAAELASFKIQLNCPSESGDEAYLVPLSTVPGAGSYDGSVLFMMYVVRPGDLMHGVQTLNTISTRNKLSFSGVGYGSATIDIATNYGSFSLNSQNLKFAGLRTAVPAGNSYVGLVTVPFTTQGAVKPSDTRLIKVWSTDSNLKLISGGSLVLTNTFKLNGGTVDAAMNLQIQSAAAAPGTYRLYYSDVTETDPAKSFSTDAFSVLAPTYEGISLYDPSLWNSVMMQVGDGTGVNVPKNSSTTLTFTYVGPMDVLQNGNLTFGLGFLNNSINTYAQPIVFTNNVNGQPPSVTITVSGSTLSSFTTNVVALYPYGVPVPNLTQPSVPGTGNQYIRPYLSVNDSYGLVTVQNIFPDIPVWNNGSRLQINSDNPQIGLQEGQSTTNMWVEFDNPLSSPLTLTFSTLNASKTGTGNALFRFTGLTTDNKLTIAAGSKRSQPFGITALNGTTNAYLRVSATGYTANDVQLSINNTAPGYDPAYTQWSPSDGASAKPLTDVPFYVELRDVLADNLTMTVTYGDGAVSGPIAMSKSSADPYALFIGSVNHQYTKGGAFTWRITVTDNGPGQNLVWTQSGTITITTPRFVNVYKMGSGRGTAFMDSGVSYVPRDYITGSEVSPSDPSTLVFTFSLDTQNAIISAFPFTSVYQNSTRTQQQSEIGYDPVLGNSYFFAWRVAAEAEGLIGTKDQEKSYDVAVDFTKMQQDNNAVATSAPISIDALFSSEYILGDGVGDYDLDGLPDVWETKYWPLSKPIEDTDRALVESGAGNSDGDLLPLVGRTWVWPLSSEKGVNQRTFATTSGTRKGGTFNNLLEARGYDPVTGFDSLNTWSSNPYAYGSSPLLYDSSQDPENSEAVEGYSDGWRYYFWNIVKNDPNATNYVRAFDVTFQSPGGIAILMDAQRKAEVLAQFSAGAYLGNDIDTDNDGLADWLEYTLGTNPLHFDTDGDGVPDGLEVYRGTDPLDGRDGLMTSYNNTDGDYMAYAADVSKMAYVLIPTNGYNYVYIPNIETNLPPFGANAMDMLGTGRVFQVMQYGVYPEGTFGANSATIAKWTIIRKVSTNDMTSLYFPDTTFVTQTVCAVHAGVYDFFGFDPRTAWAKGLPYPNIKTANATVYVGAANTRPFTAMDEALLLSYNANYHMKCFTDEIFMDEATWELYTTDPIKADTDDDGVPDGWELYVKFDPANTEDSVLWGAENAPIFTVLENFCGVQSCDQYDGVTTIVNVHEAAGWLNKTWPTDPWNYDTDGDGVSDLREGTAFVYAGAAVPERYAGNDFVSASPTCTPGAGLNPCTVDTDADGLPDGWEAAFAKDLAGIGTYGMDGTLDDATADNDYDGLRNYQEYWTQAVRHFRHDLRKTVKTNEVDIVTGQTNQVDMTVLLWNTIRQMDSMIITTPAHAWDAMAFADDPYFFMLPIPPLGQKVAGVNDLSYGTTDPRDPDSDYDGMDDYYEMFHGLNPLMGGDIVNGIIDIVGAMAGVSAMPTAQSMDFINSPWLAGLPGADPDYDGLSNTEEALVPNMAGGQNYHTDPSPLWMTDLTYTNSLTARFYQWPVAMTFGWTKKVGNYEHPYITEYMYNFEMNEGFDTDNDGVCDKDKILLGRDPLDSMSISRRQALWFDGINSFAATPLELPNFGAAVSMYSPDDFVTALRSYTIEMWVRPERLDREQVLIERPCYYPSTNTNQPNATVKCLNFRVGISEYGWAYAKYTGAAQGVEEVALYNPSQVLATNQWVHIAVRMDGVNSKLTLFVNGTPVSSKTTSLIPANGVLSSAAVPSQGTNDLSAVYYRSSVPSPVYLGAALTENRYNPPVDYFKGWMDEVRVWDGARSDSEIGNDYTKRYTRVDMAENRRMVATQVAAGYTRRQGSSLQLAPALTLHYSFNTLFGAGYTALGQFSTDVPAMTVPKGFDFAESFMPADFVTAWQGAASTVYTNTRYVPWIENNMGNLPLRGSISNGQYTASDEVLDSRFWAETHSGRNKQTSNVFPNSANPYGLYWVIDNHQSAYDLHYYQLAHSLARTGVEIGGMNYTGALIPAGAAWPKPVDMWDGMGTSGPLWMDLSMLDSDGDGLPDWWEKLYYPNTGAETIPLSDKYGWMSPFVDEWGNPNGKTNGEQFMEDMGKGQWADSDNDGLPDWWEEVFGLDPTDSTGENGWWGDPDGDGLPNHAEYLSATIPTTYSSGMDGVSDFFLKGRYMATYGALFTDSDFIEDLWENQFAVSYANPNKWDADGDSDQDGWSNWSEARYRRGYREGTRADAIMSRDPFYDSAIGSGQWIYEMPLPVIRLNINLATINEPSLVNGSKIVLWGYSDKGMNGVPDATYIYRLMTRQTLTQRLGWYKNEKISGVLSPGYLLGGTIYFAGRTVDSLTRVAMDNGAGKIVNVLRSVDATGNTTYTPGSTICGTIDYVTGEYKNLDLSATGVTAEMDVIAEYDFKIPRAKTLNLTFSEGYRAYFDAALAQTEGQTAIQPDRYENAGLVDGHLREGKNSFLVFIDTSDAKTTPGTDATSSLPQWLPGMFAGVPAPDGMGDFSQSIGWDRKTLSVTLSENAMGFPRFSWADSGLTVGTNGTWDVVITRAISSSGTYTFRKMFAKDRTFIHEGDFLGGWYDVYGNPAPYFGMEWNPDDPPVFAAPVVYDVSVNGVSLGQYDMRYPLGAAMGEPNVADYQPNRIRPTVVAPKGEIIYSGLPSFRWSALEGASAFGITVSGSDGFTYSTGYQNMPAAVSTAPSPLNTGVLLHTYEWTAPLVSGLNLPDGDYTWTVTHYAPFAQAGYAASGGSFRMNARYAYTNRLESSDTAWITVNVKYVGMYSFNDMGMTELGRSPIRVEAFESADLSGVPAAGAVLAWTETAGVTNMFSSGIKVALVGLSPDTRYYVRSYFDLNNNGVHDVFEPWGYIREDGSSSWTFDVKGVVAMRNSAAASTGSLWMQDLDTDNDGIPDTYEYQVYGNLTSMGASGGSALLRLSTYGVQALSLMTAEELQDPIVQYVLLGLSASGTTDGSALSNAQGLSLLGTAFSPTTKNYALKLNSFAPVANGKGQLSWQFVETPKTAVSAGSLFSTSAAASETPVTLVKPATYVVEVCTDLAGGTWVEWSRFTAGSEGSYELNLPDASSAFFRVRVAE